MNFVDGPGQLTFTGIAGVSLSTMTSIAQKHMGNEEVREFSYTATFINTASSSSPVSLRF